MYKMAILTGLFACCIKLQAQLCNAPGQTPVSAILVCGTESFLVTTPTFCGMQDVPTPCPPGPTYQNTNPNFFRMNCFQSGTLGFTIVPDDPTADYNWQLFDITNINPASIFTDPALFVACNWSSEVGETGATVDGTSLVVCSGQGQPVYTKMPDLQSSHTYLLMVVNQTGRPGNYALTFLGGTAAITDNIEPHLKFARANCSGSELIVRLNKKIRCETLSGDGSEFSISNGINVSAAIAGDCSPYFGSDSLVLSLDRPITPGNYTLTIHPGSDGNTVADICNREIASNETISFTVTPPQATPLDSVFKPGCTPSTIELIFQHPIRCSSVAANGSDFIITGPQPVSITSANTACNADITASRIIRLQLASPIVKGGIYQVMLVNGSDGNSITNECDFSTAINSTVAFEVQDTVSAMFTYSSKATCKSDTVTFQHPGGNGINSWQWNFGNAASSVLPNPVMTFPGSGQQTVQLTVSNGSCSNTYTRSIVLSNELIADFDAPGMICPGDPIQFVDKTKGYIDSWQWNFGNGHRSTGQYPSPQYYPATRNELYYTIELVVRNTAANCGDTVRKNIKALGNCFIAVPGAFTPNGDGLNDLLFPLNAYKADNLEFTVYNRYGQLLFYTKDWTRKWDGRSAGVSQPAGVYAWILKYVNRDTGENVFMKGTTLLIR